MVYFSVTDFNLLQMDQQHLRIKAFYGTAENAVKTQMWAAITVYVFVAIVKKCFKTAVALHNSTSSEPHAL